MTTVHKPFSDFRQGLTIWKLSREFGHDPLLKKLMVRYEVPVSFVLSGREDSEFWDELWATGCLTGNGERNFAQVMYGRLTADLLWESQRVHGASSKEDFARLDRLYHDWKMVAVLAHLHRDDFQDKPWEELLRTLNQEPERKHYYSMRDVMRRSDPEEVEHARRRRSKYEATDRAKEVRRKFHSQPEQRAKRAQLMRDLRASRRMEASTTVDVPRPEPVHDVLEAAE